MESPCSGSMLVFRSVLDPQIIPIMDCWAPVDGLGYECYVLLWTR